MQIKTGTARGQPLFLIYRLCYCSRAGERGVGGAPASWACRPAGASGHRGIRHHARATGSDFSASGTRLGCRRQEGPASVWMRLRPGGAGWGCRPAGASGRRGIRHHARATGSDFPASGKLGVVLCSPLTLVPSSRGTTPLGSDGPPASWV